MPPIDLPEGIVRFLEWFLELLANFLLWLGVEPTTFNMLALLALIFVTLVFLLRAMDFNKAPRRELRLREGSKEEDEVNLVASLSRYPIVYKLVSEETRGWRGWYVKKQHGKRAWLNLGEEYFDLETVAQLPEREIVAIEKSTGGRFSLHLSDWKTVQKLTLGVEVILGTQYFFPGGEGAIDYLFASPASDNEGGETEGFILLENPHIPNKPSKLRTWTMLHAQEITPEEFDQAVGDILEEVKKVA